jgi:hypothetical protein
MVSKTSLGVGCLKTATNLTPCHRGLLGRMRQSLQLLLWHGSHLLVTDNTVFFRRRWQTSHLPCGFLTRWRLQAPCVNGSLSHAGFSCLSFQPNFGQQHIPCFDRSHPSPATMPHHLPISNAMLSQHVPSREPTPSPSLDDMEWWGEKEA